MTNTTQHTPEYSARLSFNNPLPETDHWVVQNNKSGEIIAKLYGGDAEAFARLIAAVPETAKERDELRTEVERLGRAIDYANGVINQANIREQKAEAQRDELMAALKHLLEDAMVIGLSSSALSGSGVEARNAIANTEKASKA